MSIQKYINYKILGESGDATMRSGTGQFNQTQTGYTNPQTPKFDDQAITPEKIQEVQSRLDRINADIERLTNEKTQTEQTLAYYKSNVTTSTYA